MFGESQKQWPTERGLHILLAGICLGGGMLGIWFLYGTQFSQWGQMINSDALYLPALFRDLFIDGGAMKDWHLTPAPYWFPDMALYFFSNTLFSELFDAIYCYAMLQVLITVLLVALIYHQIINDFSRSTTVAALLVLLPTALLVFDFSGTMVHIILSAHHFGALLGGLLCVGLCARYVRSASGAMASLFSIAIFTVIVAASDLLFVLWFAMPMAGAVLFLALRSQLSWKRALLFVMVLAVASVCGKVAGDFFSGYPKVGLYLGFGLDNAVRILVKNLWKLHDLVIYRTVLFVAICASVFGFGKILRVWKERDGERDPYVSFVVVTAVVCLCLSAAVFSTAGLREDRYYIGPFLFPFFMILVPLLADRRRQRVLLGKPAHTLLVIGFLGFMGVIVGSKWPATVHSSFSSPIADCVDRLAREHDLKRGIGQYWHAKHTSMLSKEGVRVVQVGSDLKPYFWICNKSWANDPYDFAIIDKLATGGYKLDRARIEAINGKPARIVECADSVILIYGKGKLRTEPAK